MANIGVHSTSYFRLDLDRMNVRALLFQGRIESKPQVSFRICTRISNIMSSVRRFGRYIAYKAKQTKSHSIRHVTACGL